MKTREERITDTVRRFLASEANNTPPNKKPEKTVTKAIETHYKTFAPAHNLPD